MAAPELPPLDAALAERLVAVALDNVTRRRPFHLQHLARSDDDIAPPEQLHPVFHGSYDWHSCVHMFWTLARCLRRFPQAKFAAAVADTFNTRLTPQAVAGELRYCAARPTFERPYGWGWLLKLHAELTVLAQEDPARAHWAQALAPLAALFADAWQAYLPRAAYPVRAGTHGNSAFALILALQWAEATRHAPLAAAIRTHAARWFAEDRAYPQAYEPSGDDFLSAGLCEARLMQRVLAPAQFAPWWSLFMPQSPTHWLQPVAVSDASDAKIVHLHGLNLSRAACWRGLLPQMPTLLQPAVQRAIADHWSASQGAALSGDYVGTHWLASFALLALDEGL